jgi:hypothetical protein
MKKLISLLFITSILFAQQKWIKTYGGTNEDFSRSVQQTSDGGYIIGGSTTSFGAGGADVWLIKTNLYGDTLWTRTYGGTNHDLGNSVQQTADRGYIIAGETWSFGAGNDDVYLIKTDSIGDTLWTRTYGGTSNDLGNSVRQTTDGGYIIAGNTESYGAYTDVYLIKTNAYGDTLWTRTYGGTSSNDGKSVQETIDGGYIVTGRTLSFGAGSWDVWLIKTNVSGDTLWTRTYGGTNWDEGWFIQQTQDGGYIIAGLTFSYGAGNEDVYLIKTDSIGDTIWTKTYGGVNGDAGYSVQQTADSGYIIVGYTDSFGAGSFDFYVIKTNSFGDTLWTRTYGGMNGDWGNSVRETSDGGYIIAGFTTSFGAGNGDVYLIKTDANGNAAVEERKSRAQNLPVNLKAVPNPFTSFARIPGYEKEEFALSDITGRLVGKYNGAKIGENLPAGVYFVMPQNKNLSPLRIVKVR